MMSVVTQLSVMSVTERPPMVNRQPTPTPLIQTDTTDNSANSDNRKAGRAVTADVRIPMLDSPAHQALTAALTNAVARGQFVPCASWGDENNPWLSDSADDRRWAADRCRHCPAIEECRQAGQLEGWGVWGAIDRTPTKKTTRAPRADQ